METRKGFSYCDVATTHYEELKRRRLGRGFLGLGEGFDVLVRQPGLQLLGVLLPFHLSIRSPLLEKKKKDTEGKECSVTDTMSYVSTTSCLFFN